MKKFICMLLALSLVIGLAGCGEKKEQKSLVMGFVPLIDGEKLVDSVAPLSDILSESIGVKVDAFTASNYLGVVEAIGSGQVDFGIIPPFAYVLANKESNAKILLSAINKNGKSSYRSEFVVRKDSGIKNTDDLKGKKIAFVDLSSSSGYIYPGAHLVKKGFDLDKDVKTAFSGGHDVSLQLLLNKDVDCVAVYEGARDKIAKEFPALLEETEVIEYTEDIPYITVTVRSGMDPEMEQKIKDGIMNTLNEGEGKELITELFGLHGFVEATDADYDGIRETAELMNIDLKNQE